MFSRGRERVYWVYRGLKMISKNVSVMVYPENPKFFGATIITAFSRAYVGPLSNIFKHLHTHFLYLLIWKLPEDPESRPGFCPAPIFDRCDKERSPDEIIERGCLLDNECDVGEKCCSDGCNLVCTVVELPPEPTVIKGEPGDPGDPGERVCSSGFVNCSNIYSILNM